MKLVTDQAECDEEDGTCDEIREEFDFVKYMVAEDALKYKYVIDVYVFPSFRTCTGPLLVSNRIGILI